MALPISGGPDDLPRMAMLWEHLPEGSRCARRNYPELKWDSSTYMLWRIEYQLRLLAWGMADKKKRPAEPQPIKTPGEIAELERRKANALASRAEIDAILGLGGHGGD
nr:MAG TPA: protein of unknown function (DUF5361) [Caudoviricetes sp.]